MKSTTPELKKSLALYLANEETEHILFRPCRVSICMIGMFNLDEKCVNCIAILLVLRFNSCMFLPHWYRQVCYKLLSHWKR